MENRYKKIKTYFYRNMSFLYFYSLVYIFVKKYTKSLVKLKNNIDISLLFLYTMQLVAHGNQIFILSYMSNLDYSSWDAATVKYFGLLWVFFYFLEGRYGRDW